MPIPYLAHPPLTGNLYGVQCRLLPRKPVQHDLPRKGREITSNPWQHKQFHFWGLCWEPRKLDFWKGNTLTGHRSDHFGKSVLETTHAQGRLCTLLQCPLPSSLPSVPPHGFHAHSASHSTRPNSRKGLYMALLCVCGEGDMTEKRSMYMTRKFIQKKKRKAQPKSSRESQINCRE